MKSKPIENKSGWFVTGGIMASLIASLCCVGPLILTILGISGAAALSRLEVLRIPMIVIVLFLFGLAGVSLYRKRKICEPGSICADPEKYRRMILFYWVGVMIAIISMTSPEWVVLFFD